MDVEPVEYEQFDLDYEESVSSDCTDAGELSDSEYFPEECKTNVDGLNSPNEAYLINIISLEDKIEGDEANTNFPMNTEDPNDKLYLNIHKRLIKIIHNYSVEPLTPDWLQNQKVQESLRKQVKHYRNKAIRLSSFNKKLKLKVSKLEQKIVYLEREKMESNLVPN